MSVFTADTSQIDRLVQEFKAAPKIYGRAASVMLNEYAFESKRRWIPQTLADTMIVRDPKFAKSRIRVKKASPRSNLTQIVAYVGSVADKPRFSGWIEQQTGQRTNKKRTFGLQARRGKRGGKALRRARMRAGQHPGPALMGTRSSRVKTPQGLAQAFLVWTRRNNFKRPFRLFNHPTIAPGLFEWRGGKLRRLQHFDANRDAQPKKTYWLSKAADRMVRNTDPLRLWQQSIKRVSDWT